MAEASGKSIEYWGVDGGASNNDLLMQFQADVLRATLVRPKFREVTSLGAAKAVQYALGLAVNRGPTSHQPPHLTTSGADEFKPQMTELEASRLHDEWDSAARAVHQLYGGNI
jgi:glycerol kinase